MNQLKIVFTGFVVKRWRKPLSSGKEKVFIAISDGAATFPRVLQFTAKDIEVVKPFKVGDKVTVEAWVDGREWKKTESESVFFVDLTIIDIKAVEAPAPKDEDDIGDQASGGEELPF